MNKTLPCYIVSDLLPLYQEDIVSEQTKKDIDEHLLECEDCKKKLEAIQMELTIPCTAPEVKINPFKKLRLYQNILMLLFAGYTIVLALIILFKFDINYTAFLHEMLSKNNEVNRVNLVPFRNIRTYLDVWGSYGFENLAGHVVAFIPVGIGIRYLFAKNSIKAVLWCLLITVLFEMIQYVFCIGFLDVDDIILNLMGSVIGILVCKWFMRKRKSFSQ